MVTQAQGECKGKIGPRGAEVLLLLSTVLWGMSFVMVKVALSVTGPFTFTAVRSLLAIPFLLFVFPRRQVRALSIPSLATGGLLGVILFAVYAFQTLGLTRTTASNASLLTCFYVVLIALLAARWIKESVGIHTWVGIGLSVIGSLTLTGGAVGGFAGGDLLVLVSTAFIAIHVVAIQAWTKRHDPFLLTTVQILVLGVLSGVVALIWERPIAISSSPRFWGPLAVTTLGVTVLCFLIQSTMQRLTTASMSAVIYATEGFWGAFFGWLIAGEIITLRVMVGGICMFAGIAAAQYSSFYKVVRRFLTGSGR